MLMRQVLPLGTIGLLDRLVSVGVCFPGCRMAQ